MDLLAFPPELINFVTKHLCIVDRMSLRFTCWDLYYSYIDLDITPFIRKRIEDYIDSDEFLSLIGENVIISGSFLVACLYDTYDYNDIDIYENYYTINPLIKEHGLDSFCEIYHNQADYDLSEITSPGYGIRYPSDVKKYSKMTNFLAKEIYPVDGNRKISYITKQTVDETFSISNYEINGLNFQRIIMDDIDEYFVKLGKKNNFLNIMEFI